MADDDVEVTLAEDDVEVQLLWARLSKGPHVRESERREGPQGKGCLRMMSKYSCGRALSKGPHVREPERRGWPRLLSKYSRLNVDEGVGRPGRTKYLVKRLMKRPSRQA